MKVLFVHTHYRQNGGEDLVFQNEKELLASAIQVEDLIFSNFGGKLTTLIHFLLAPWNVLSARRIRKAIKVSRPDIIHIHNWYFAASPLIIREAKKMGIPVVHTLHNFRLLCPSATLFHKGKLFENSLKEHFPWTAIRKGVYKDSSILTFWNAFIVKFHEWLGTWKMVDRYIVLSPFAKELLQESSLGLYPDQLIVKPNFVRDISFTVADRQDYFLFVGRLSEEKGVRVLLDSVVGTDISLIIAGEGLLADEVRLASERYSNIQYVGFKDAEAIKRLMQGAQALIFPSLWYEGMPMTMLESFACSTPIIASELGAMKNIVTHEVDGLLFEPGNADDLFGALSYWINLNEEQRGTMRNNARLTYEKEFCAKQNQSQLLNIYSEAMKNNLNGQTEEVLGFPVFTGKLEDIKMEEKAVINTVNQYSYMLSVQDPSFKQALSASDMLLPDGVGIVLAAGFLKGKKIKKIAGADIHQFLLEYLNKIAGSCFYLGSSENTLRLIKKRIQCEFPKIVVHSYSPPYKSEFHEEDNAKMISVINEFQPDVLFVGMTAPKQEKWVFENSCHLNVKKIVSIGAVFDFYGGTIRRPSAFWINLGLEWFVRLVKEPKRMWKRYIYNGPLFLFELFKRRIYS